MVKAIDLLLDLIEGEGVTHIFGLPGRAIDPLMDSLYDREKLNFILVRDEEGGSLMANGYARVAETLGVCCGTTGGGTTKLVTGVASAYMDSIPLLAITGQVETSKFGRGAFQESTAEGRSLDAVGLFQGHTKYSTLVFQAQSLPRKARKAIRSALSGRPGPVHLNIPFDVQNAVLNKVEKCKSSSYRVKSDLFDRDGVKAAVRLLKDTERVALIAGAGMVSKRGGLALAAFAKELGIPIVTSLKGKGALDERHPFCFGCHGLVGTPAAHQLLRSGIDVLIACGTSLNEFSTDGWDNRMSPKKGLIQIDIDSDEIGKNHPVEVGVVGDGARVLVEMIYESRRQKVRRKYSESQLLTLKKLYGGMFHLPEKLVATQNHILPQRVMAELRQALPENAIVIGDSGNNCAFALHYFPCHRNGGFLTGMGLGTMGYAAGAAVGAQVAAGSAPVVAICGDGAFMMHMNEVATAVQYGIPVIWLVLNDARLGMVYCAQKYKMNNRIIGTTYSQLPLARLSRAMGAVGMSVKTPGKVKQAVKRALRLNKPTVIEVLIDRQEVPPMAARLGKAS